jgi:hypothetical protein
VPCLLTQQNLVDKKNNTTNALFFLTDMFVFKKQKYKQLQNIPTLKKNEDHSLLFAFRFECERLYLL